MLSLPSRYEDLDEAFRGRLRPIPQLIEVVQRAGRSMEVSGGLRFLPMFGESGVGKTCAANELGTHLPEARVLHVPRSALDSLEELKAFMREVQRRNTDARLLVAVIDQYEETVATRGDVPSQFVEWLSLLDRDREFTSAQWLFLWLTTSRDFQLLLEQATTRNRRILTESEFELAGPQKSEWPQIIEETFAFHNERPLADFGLVQGEVAAACFDEPTLGAAILRVGDLLDAHVPRLHDISSYLVVMLWPVTDGRRINTVLRFVDARNGYRLDWNTWYRQLNAGDREQLPLAEYNRARLYFDIRLVPIAAADLHPLCRDLDDESTTLHDTYLQRFSLTHYVSVVRGDWDAARYAPLRERESQRAADARVWYSSITREPTKVGRRLARVLESLGIPSSHEENLESPHARLRADILSTRPSPGQGKVITELKLYSPENTMPSTIRDSVRTTLRKHAQFAGFLERQ